MPANTNHLYAIRVSDGERVFIDEKGLPNGKKCGCICSRCKEPLAAKNHGKINAHHFAHRSDSDCRGETHAHMEAKEIIKKKKYLWVPTIDGFKKEKFNTVQDEEKIGNSAYKADLICKDDDQSIIVEIVVTHELEYEKLIYLEENDLDTLSIDLKSVLEKDKYNKLPFNFSRLVLKKAQRKWIINRELETQQEILEEKRTADAKKVYKEYAIKRDKELRPLKTALQDIRKKNNPNELIYGTLVYADLRKFDIYGDCINDKLLCVKSDHFSEKFDNLAYFINDDEPPSRYILVFDEYVGKRVGVKMINDINKYDDDMFRMPHCIVFWIEPNKNAIAEDEEDFDEERLLSNFKIENEDRINEFKEKCSYTKEEVERFLKVNYDPERELQLIARINKMILDAEA